MQRMARNGATLSPERVSAKGRNPPVADLGRCVASGYYDFRACATQPRAPRHEGLRQVITKVFQNCTQFPIGEPIFLPHPRQVAEISPNGT